MSTVGFQSDITLHTFCTLDNTEGVQWEYLLVIDIEEPRSRGQFDLARKLLLLMLRLHVPLGGSVLRPYSLLQSPRKPLFQNESAVSVKLTLIN